MRLGLVSTLMFSARENEAKRGAGRFGQNEKNEWRFFEMEREEAGSK